MEMYNWLKPIMDEKIYKNKLLPLAVGENQLTEFIFNEGITHGRDLLKEEIEKLEKLEKENVILKRAFKKSDLIVVEIMKMIMKDNIEEQKGLRELLVTLEDGLDESTDRCKALDLILI